MLTLDALLSCLPQAYDRSAPGVLAEATVAAAVMDRAIDSAGIVLAEHQPGMTAVALLDWERNYNLPDGCAGGLAASEATRRTNLLERISARGNLSRAYYIDLAERLGYADCTITEFGPMSCEDPCDGYLNGPEFIGVWRLNVSGAELVTVPATCASPCDSALLSWGDTQLECAITKRKPAHTHVFFAYYDLPLVINPLAIILGA